MENLSNLPVQKLEYLKDKWGAEIIEMQTALSRAQLKLEAKLEKSNDTSESMAAAMAKLTQKEEALQFILDNNGTEGQVLIAEAEIAEASLAVDALVHASGSILPEEVQTTILTFEEIQDGIARREAKIIEINTVLGNTA